MTRWSLFVFAAVVGATAIACKVPVFRYALERWPSDSYRMVAIIDDTKDIDVANALVAMAKLDASPANVETETINLSKLSEEELWQIEGMDDTDSVPLLQVFYPERDGQRSLCWSGELTTENVLAWSDSPLRQRIIKDLQSGVSAVWMLVPGDDDAQNDRIKTELAGALKRASEEIEISDGVVKRSDAAQYMQENPGASMDDVLRSDIPLRIDFSIQTISQNDDDWALLAMIDQVVASDSQNESVPRPFVLPVFGRGRMIEPLSAERFSADNIVGACKYLVGECSCTVKSQNPGVDLLLNTPWQEKLGEQVVMVSSPLNTKPTKVPIPSGEPTASDEPTASKPRISVQPLLNKRNAIAVTLMAVVAGFTIAVGVGMRNRKKRKR